MIIIRKYSPKKSVCLHIVPAFYQWTNNVLFFLEVSAYIYAATRTAPPHEIKKQMDDP